ncbi:hypothetical protein HDU97_006200 [Phlyctochytrium planicorne]|nr:hypothetical protein HDU97_006200 [Phlyctochytrium planicorne]
MIFFAFYVVLLFGVVGALLFASTQSKLLEGFQPVPTEDVDEGMESSMDSQRARRYVVKESQINLTVQEFFYRLGHFAARFPYFTIMACAGAVFFLSIGWAWFSIETDPVKLWVGKESFTAKEKLIFDTNFGPFYRTQQFILHSTNGESVITRDLLREVFLTVDGVKSLKSPASVTLNDLCTKPIGDACIIQSVTAYWESLDAFDNEDWKDQFELCVNDPVQCLPDFQQPIKPDLVLGGFRDSDYDGSQAIFVTFVLENSVDQELEDRAVAWERELLRYFDVRAKHIMSEHPNVTVSYSTESSIETEINKESKANAMTIIISYLVMFVYASLALGKINHPSRIFVDSRFSLGLMGICIVLSSVSVSVGIFSFFGVKVTLIIAEVIPFLVLAVGVDNIFILCHAFDSISSEFPVEDRAALALAKVGPSILLAAVSETVAFSMGVFVSMPAVSVFSMYAAMAVFVDFVLQVTCFMSLLVLDSRRSEANRIDCIPCLKFPSAFPKPVVAEEGYLQAFIRKVYSPFLMNQEVKYGVFTSFLAMFFVFLALLRNVELGLNQREAVPRDSYLVDYFNDLDEYFRVGPPLYFVAEGSNGERKRPNISYIAQPTASWLDDFFLWLNPQSELCCRTKPSKVEGKRELCQPTDNDDACELCYQPGTWNYSMQGFPEGVFFTEHVKLFLQSIPSQECPLGGAAAYSNAIVVDDEEAGNGVKLSHFRTYHKPLKSQSELIGAYQAARRIASDISKETGISVFPYSVFYVFFEQYTSIIKVAVTLIAVACLPIFIITATFLTIRNSLLVVVTTLMIVVDLVGLMSVVGVSLNALSTVNLVIAVGISVEFLSHITRSFTVKSGSRDQRAFEALVEMGGSIFSGITVTKFVGVSILFFAKSKIFEIYYFRMRRNELIDEDEDDEDADEGDRLFDDVLYDELDNEPATTAPGPLANLMPKQAAPSAEAQKFGGGRVQFLRVPISTDDESSSSANDLKSETPGRSGGDPLGVLTGDEDNAYGGTSALSAETGTDLSLKGKRQMSLSDL